MNHKKIIFFLAMIIIASLSTIAVDEYKDWVDDEGTISFNERSFKLSILEDKIKVESDGFISVLDLNECVFIDNVNFCVMDIRYNLTKESYESKVNLTKKYADLAVTRTLSSSALIISKEYYVDVTVENKGNYLAKNITYTEFFPENLGELIDCDDCDIEGENIIFSDSISSGEKKSFRYQFIPLSDEQYSSTAEVEYYSKGKKETFYTSALKISPTHPIKITFKYNKYSLVGDEVELSVDITNNQEGNVYVSDVQIYIPSNLDIKINNRVYQSGKAYSLGSFTLNDVTSYYTISKTTSKYVNGSYTNVTENITKVNQSKTKNYFLDMVPKAKGDYEFAFDIYYEYNEKLLKYQGVRSKFTIKALSPTVDVNINDNQNFDETSKQYIYVQLVNPYEHISVNNAILKIESPLLLAPKTYRIDYIERGVSKRIFFENFIFPKLNGTTVSTYFRYNLTFYDEHGNFYEIHEKIPFKIVPLDNILISSTGCSIVKFDSECEVIVSATNKLKGDISNVFIRDVYSENIATSGVLYTKTPIEGTKKIIAYKYDIIYPEDVEDFHDSVNVTTFVTYDYLGEKYSLSSTRTIYFEDFSNDKKDFKLGLSTLFDSTSFYQGSIYPVTLVVENKDDETLSNLVLELKESPDFDMVDEKNKTLISLNPGEKKDFRFFIKIKSNKTLSAIGKLKFNSQKGYGYEEEFVKKNINVNSQSPIGPFIAIEMYSSNDNPSVGDLVPINIRIDNKGTEEAYLKVRFSEGEKEQVLLLKENSYRILKKNMLISAQGNVSVPVVLSEYEYAKRKYYSSSNELFLEAKPLETIIEYESEPEEEVIDQNINKNEEQENDNNSNNFIAEENKEGGSWFSRFIGRIVSFFTI